MRPQAAELAAALVRMGANVLTWPLRPRARAYAKAILAEDLAPEWVTETPYGPIRFHCPGRWPYSRSDMGKERGTYRWIDGFEPGSVFWDVGANVGVFTLYASAKGLKVVSFEPEASNYHVLARNLDLNDAWGNVTALNAAMADRTGVTRLAIGEGHVGGAGHSIGNVGRTVFGISGREAISRFDLAPPNYIKIDVDGAETRVVAGLDLSSNDLRGVQVELRPDGQAETVFELMKSNGFKSGHPLPERTANICFSRV